MKAWIPFKQVDFTDQTIRQYHVDTRDFCVLCNEEEYPEKTKNDRDYKPLPDLHVLLKYRGRFFYSDQEVLDLITRLFTESGGEKKWRHLVLEGDGSWRLKYIRIYRTKHGNIVCNNDNYAMSKNSMEKPVKTQLY